MNKNCFVIAPIGEMDSEIRKRSDKILKHIISPAVEKFQFKAIRADQISEPGIITSQVIQHIIEDPLVIADLTGRNPNVFYELAIRHAIRKPCIQIIQDNEVIPFDVAATRIIKIDHQDLDSVESAKSEIILQLNYLESSPDTVESPISITVDLNNLNRSNDAEKRSIADLVTSFAEIRNTINRIERHISSPNKIFPLDYLDVITKQLKIQTLSWHAIDRLRDISKDMQFMVEQFRDGGYSKKILDEIKFTDRIEVYALEIRSLMDNPNQT